jgi:hypothetical protein
MSEVASAYFAVLYEDAKTFVARMDSKNPLTMATLVKELMHRGTDRRTCIALAGSVLCGDMSGSMRSGDMALDWRYFDGKQSNLVLMVNTGRFP